MLGLKQVEWFSILQDMVQHFTNGIIINISLTDTVRKNSHKDQSLTKSLTQPTASIEGDYPIAFFSLSTFPFRCNVKNVVFKWIIGLQHIPHNCNILGSNVAQHLHFLQRYFPVFLKEIILKTSWARQNKKKTKKTAALYDKCLLSVWFMRHLFSPVTCECEQVCVCVCSVSGQMCWGHAFTYIHSHTHTYTYTQ